MRKYIDVIQMISMGCLFAGFMLVMFAGPMELAVNGFCKFIVGAIAIEACEYLLPDSW